MDSQLLPIVHMMPFFFFFLFQILQLLTFGQTKDCRKEELHRKRSAQKKKKKKKNPERDHVGPKFSLIYFIQK